MNATLNSKVAFSAAEWGYKDPKSLVSTMLAEALNNFINERLNSGDEISKVKQDIVFLMKCHHYKRNKLSFQLLEQILNNHVKEMSRERIGE